LELKSEESAARGFFASKYKPQDYIRREKDRSLVKGVSEAGKM